ncbi:hypothetical protein [Haladaptatus sp. NG-SE-30]
METRANQWLGEAQAVVADAKRAPESVVKKRVLQADDLLSNVDGTGDSEADEHVEQARTLTSEILAELD